MKKKPENNFAVYLDYDSLFDTRYGRLITMHPSLKEDLLFKFPTFETRRNDNMSEIFGVVNDKAFSEKRITLDVIKNSPRTAVHKLVAMAYRSFQGHFKEKAGAMEIVLNLMDYPIPTEAYDSYRLLLSAAFEHQVEVKLINRPVKKVTPSWLRRKFDLAVIYDFERQIDLFPPTSKVVYEGIVIYTPLRLTGSERDFAKAIESVRCSHGTAEIETSGEITILSEFWSMYLEVHIQEMAYFTTISPMPLDEDIEVN